MESRHLFSLILRSPQRCRVFPTSSPYVPKSAIVDLGGRLEGWAADSEVVAHPSRRGFASPQDEGGGRGVCPGSGKAAVRDPYSAAFAMEPRPHGVWVPGSASQPRDMRVPPQPPSPLVGEGDSKPAGFERGEGYGPIEKSDTPHLARPAGRVVISHKGRGKKAERPIDSRRPAIRRVRNSGRTAR